MAAALRSAVSRVLFQRRALSFSAFSQPPPVPPPKAEPSTQLFVSGSISVRLTAAFFNVATGLNKRTTTEKLRETFAKFGQLVEARVVTDRVSGFSKGFGFVKYGTVQEAEEAIKGMDGQFLEGWIIFVEYARPRAPRPAPSQQAPLPSAIYADHQYNRN